MHSCQLPLNDLFPKPEREERQRWHAQSAPTGYNCNLFASKIFELRTEPVMQTGNLGSVAVGTFESDGVRFRSPLVSLPGLYTNPHKPVDCPRCIPITKSFADPVAIQDIHSTSVKKAAKKASRTPDAASGGLLPLRSPVPRGAALAGAGT